MCYNLLVIGISRVCNLHSEYFQLIFSYKLKFNYLIPVYNLPWSTSIWIFIAYCYKSTHDDSLNYA